MRASCQRTPKNKCGPVARPVDPTRPSVWPPAWARNLHSEPAPVAAPPLGTSPCRPGSIAARSSPAAAPSLLRPDTAPRSAWLADNSAPATPRLLPAADCPPSLAPSPQPDSALSCSLPFSPIGVPPVAGTLNGDISIVVSGGHF